MTALPIWKDYYVYLGEQDWADFTIYVNGDILIYRGRAFIRPGEAVCQARINDICANYLTEVLPNLSDAEFSRISLPVEFAVEFKGPDGEGSDEMQFMNDWSYTERDYTTQGLAEPIVEFVDAGQWFMWTSAEAKTITATLHYADGKQVEVVIPVAISADFSMAFNSDFARSARSAGAGTAVFNLAQWPGLVSIDITDGQVSRSYKVVDTCCRYIFYYRNEFGGWDTLPIEGNTAKVDTLTRSTRDVDYDNFNPQNRGRQNYLNEIVRTYTLHTGWLTDAEAARMHHLLSSPDVYLYDKLEDVMMPVVLPDTTCDYKTYRNGHQLVNYTIRADEAHNIIRR